MQIEKRAAEWTDLGQFASALRGASLFDNRVLEIPGAVVALPLGQQVTRLYWNLVRQHYDAAGLLEYDYPFLAPLSCQLEFDKVFPSHEKILLVGTSRDFEANSPRAFLLPTGESLIYHHWSRTVRDETDLPIRMYRQARFFRPWSKRSSGIFNSIEGVDTFEFHCCYGADEGEADSHLIYNHLQQLAEDICVPVIWSTRPPWTNNAQVSMATIGGDTPLLSGATLQVGTFYRQGKVFSDAFKIRYRDRALVSRNTFHLAGAVSRRLLLAHLFVALKSDRSFFPHPSLNPCHVEVLFRPSVVDPWSSSEALVNALTAHGIRVRAKQCLSGGDVQQALSSTGVLLPTLTVLFLGRRHETDKLRVVIRRNDDSSEIVDTPGDLFSISIDLILDALSDVKNAYSKRMEEYLSRRVHMEDTLAGVRERLTQRGVVCAPMRFIEKNVMAVTEWKAGEVMGFVDSNQEQQCVLSGVPCATYAFISPRA